MNGVSFLVLVLVLIVGLGGSIFGFWNYVVIFFIFNNFLQGVKY
ncbi:hypothetical protein [uncultured Gammaproteobacteria bacterium]|nr:hypothetical protein [uncultured Gammaproteobacteria bacterium]